MPNRADRSLRCLVWTAIRPEEIARTLETRELDPAAFDHPAHVAAAWHCMTTLGPLDGGRSFYSRLLRYLRQLGRAEKLHATLTCALLQLIASRLESGRSWEDFCRANGDLFLDARALVQRHYSPALLSREVARRRPLPPDRAPLPALPVRPQRPQSDGSSLSGSRRQRPVPEPRRRPVTVSSPCGPGGSGV